MQLSFAQLEALLDEITKRLQAGELEMSEYIEEWDELMEFCGWTWPEFVVEIDKRWTTAKKVASPLFQC